MIPVQLSQMGTGVSYAIVAGMTPRYFSFLKRSRYPLQRDLKIPLDQIRRYPDGPA